MPNTNLQQTCRCSVPTHRCLATVLWAGSSSGFCKDKQRERFKKDNKSVMSDGRKVILMCCICKVWSVHWSLLWESTVIMMHLLWSQMKSYHDLYAKPKINKSLGFKICKGNRLSKWKWEKIYTFSLNHHCYIEMMYKEGRGSRDTVDFLQQSRSKFA